MPPEPLSYIERHHVPDATLHMQDRKPRQCSVALCNYHVCFARFRKSPHRRTRKPERLFKALLIQPEHRVQVVRLIPS